MKLTDKRLLTCGELVTGEVVADIGTDHGYLPIWLVESGKCSRALACDTAEKPLESARRNIMAAGLEDKITAVRSDGLKSVELSGVTDIVIAGMGGELIAEILSARELPEDMNLVLQPMTKWDVLRKWLWEKGWRVTEERACVQGDFVYSVMQCRKGRAEHPCDLKYLYCGLVTMDTEEGLEYLDRQGGRLMTAGEGKARSPREDQRLLGEEMCALGREIREEVRKSREGR